MPRNPASRSCNGSRQLGLSLIGIVAVMSLASASLAHDTLTTIRVGSFNLQWFGHPNKPRSAEGVQRMARHIDSLEVDILGCQEVNATGDLTGNGQSDWKDLLEALGPKYSGHLGSTGGSKRIALIWRNDRVVLSDIGDLNGIEPELIGVVKSFPRIPLTAYVKSRKGGLDFRLVVVHLIWESDDARHHEGEQINRWFSEYLASGADKDVLVIGDCNTKSMGAKDNGDSTTIKNIEANGHLVSVSKSHPEYTTPTTQERYDHAFLSVGLQQEEYRQASWDVHREACSAFPDTCLTSLSNHVPVSLEFVDVENDQDPAGDWGGEPASDVAQEELVLTKALPRLPPGPPWCAVLPQPAAIERQWVGANWFEL